MSLCDSKGVKNSQFQQATVSIVALNLLKIQSFHFLILAFFISIFVFQRALGSSPDKNPLDVNANVQDIKRNFGRIYGKFAESVSKACPSYSKNELVSYVSSFENTKLRVPKDYSKFDNESLTEVAESLFFKNAVLIYLDEARCAFDRVNSAISGDQNMLRILAKDLAPKIIYLRKLEQDISLVEIRVFERSFAASTSKPSEIEMRKRYEFKLKERHDILMKEWYLVYYSIWQIRMIHMQAYVRELIESGSTEEELIAQMNQEKIQTKSLLSMLEIENNRNEWLDFAHQKIKFIKQQYRPVSLKSVLKAILLEIRKDFKALSEVNKNIFSEKNPTQKLGLTRSLESFLIQSNHSWIKNYFEEVNLESHVSFKEKLFCNFNNRYNVGPGRIENGLFIATVIFTLGETFLFNVGNYIRMGAFATRIERITETLALGGAGIETIEILNKVGLRCLDTEHNLLDQTRNCSAGQDKNDLNLATLKEIEKHNCVHSLVSNITRIAGKAYHAFHIDYGEEEQDQNKTTKE